MRVLITALMLLAGVAAGQAPTYDGVDQYTDIPILDNALAAYSVAAWVNTDAAASDQAVMAQREVGDTTDILYSLRISGSKMTALVRDDVANTANAIGATTLLADTWYHAAMTREVGGIIKVYLNGVQDGTASAALGAMQTDDAAIGAWYGAAGKAAFLNGNADDARIYSTALSSNQIARLTLDTCEMYDPTLWTNSTLHAIAETWDTGYAPAMWDYERTPDKSGNGNDGTFSGGVELTAIDAGNYQAEFDGVDGYGVVPNDSSYHCVSNFTIAFRAKGWDSTPENTVVYLYSQKDAYNDNEGVMIRWENNWNDDYISFGGYRDQGIRTEDSVITDDDWHTVAIVIEDPTATPSGKIYIDGVEQTLVDDTLGTAILAPVYDTYLCGWFAATPTNVTSFTYDWLRVYPTSVLTSNEIYTASATATWPEGEGLHLDFTPAPTNYLVGAWRGDRTPYGNGEAIVEVKDKSPEGNHGTLEPAISTGPTWHGKVDECKGVYELDGTDDYLKGVDIQNLDSTAACTWATRVSFKALSDWDGIMQKYLNGSQRFTIQLSGSGQGGNDDITITIDGAGKYTTGNILSTGQEYHIVVVYDGSEVVSSDRVRIYLDAVDQGGTEVSTIPATLNDMGASVVYYGNDFHGAGRYLSAYADEWQIWDAALSATQVTNLYQGTMPTNTPVLNMTFDQRDYIIPDISGNGNDGTAVNSPTLGAAR